MSHFSVLVIGDDPENQLQPFNESLHVEHELERVSDDELASMRKYYGDRPLEKLVDQCENWFGYKGFLDSGNLYYYCAYNPNARWDWYVLGGRWPGQLKLKPGISGIVGKRSWYNNEETFQDGFGDQANFGDIDWNSSKISIPFAVLKDGKWSEKGQMGWFGSIANEKSDAQWKQEFQALLQDVSNETLISVYDCHI